ncbi:ParB/RepB/Spo0J family partition protein [Thermorudis peleae]|uniref:ParB/RepB/Spo0J family partition protein n=1 Tax=Thermorudis peleae TaxID=1382356 RepID=UPI00068F6B66|nr:ParB/RepB/Spo0J family partition protein [Thermorudis peleae]
MSNGNTQAVQSSAMNTRRRRFTVDALFADTSPRAVGTRDLPTAKEIRLDRIEPDPDQPRRSFDPERLEELAASIRREGVLQPIAVYYDAARDRYVIIHGERRWRAAQLAGLETIPALVRDVRDEQRLIQQLMENILREDLNALDRAAALRRLKQQLGDVPWEQVAEAVGIKRSRLFQLLSTEKLPPPVQEAIRAGQLSEKQTRPLHGLPEPAQVALAQLTVEEQLEQREIEQLARALREESSLALHTPESLQTQLRTLRDRLRTQPPSAAPARTARHRANGRTEVGTEPAAAVAALAAELRQVAERLAALDPATLHPDGREQLSTALAMLAAAVEQAQARLAAS